MLSFRLRLFLLLAVFWAGSSLAGNTVPLSFVSATARDNVVDIATDDGTLVRITFIREDLFHLQAGRETLPARDPGERAPIVLPHAIQKVPLRVEEHGTHHTIASPYLELTVAHDPLRLELRRLADGKILFRELKPLELGEGMTRQTLASDPGEHFFGGGQQNGRFEFKGRLMEISYSGGWEEGDRPSPAPFYMSDRGYGVLRNTWADGVYDFRSDGYLTTTHDEDSFDAFYMAGDSIHHVLDLYTWLTGRARLLPRWAFEYGDADCFNDGDNVDKPGTFPEGWSDGPTGTTPDVVASVARQYRRHDMPGGWILPNDGYGCGYTDLPEVVAELAELGFHTGLWTENGVEKIAWEVGVAGTRVQKLDVAWTGKGYQWAMDANHDAAQGFLDNSDVRPFIWTVMGWAGIQRYAVTWTGDQSGSWDYIRWHVPTLVGSGLSGMNYSTGDVDGIFGGSPETFTRDLQWKCFTPVFMGMSGWSRTERKHPWWFDEPYRSINRRFLKLRQRLMPYIYTLARETETTGAPMVRGIMWDHSGDPEAYDHPYQFFLGQDLLVAPVYNSQAASGGWRKDIHLPEGRWIDYWNGNVLVAGCGGRTVDVPVDLATLPVFVRAGAIIPMYPEALYDGQVPADPVTLDIYPGGDSEFILYEDDGNTRAYRQGEFSLQRFSVTGPDRRLEISVGPAEGDFQGKPADRRFEFLLHTRARPQSVAWDGEEIPSTPSRTEFAAVDQGWFFAPDDRFGVLNIKVRPADTATDHRMIVVRDPQTEPAVTGHYPALPSGDGSIGKDALAVVNRPAEEPGYPLENAFDGDQDTWFRTVRDQSETYGPHEFTISLGKRRLIEGFRIRPRNDKYWQYGQVRDYELYLADVNGQWNDPVAAGTLERSEEMQEIHFTPRAGRLLRFRVLSTHDAGADPMVLGVSGPGNGPYNALVPPAVGPITISEFRLLEHARPQEPPVRMSLARKIPAAAASLHMDGLEFENGLRVRGNSRIDFALAGNWHTFQAEVGLDDSSVYRGPVRFQVWGDDKLLWDSGTFSAPRIVKPRLDIRGISVLSLRTSAPDAEAIMNWALPLLMGFRSDTFAPVADGNGHGPD